MKNDIQGSVVGELDRLLAGWIPWTAVQQTDSLLQAGSTGGGTGYLTGTRNEVNTDVMLNVLNYHSW